MLKNINQHSRPLLAAALISVILLTVVYTRNTSQISKYLSDNTKQASYAVIQESLGTLQQNIPTSKSTTLPVATTKSDTDSIIDYIATGLPQTEVDTAYEKIETSFTPYVLEPAQADKIFFE